MDNRKERIRKLAYEKWEFRKEYELEGCPMGDWLDAEEEVNREDNNFVEIKKDWA